MADLFCVVCIGSLMQLFPFLFQSLSDMRTDEPNTKQTLEFLLRQGTKLLAEELSVTALYPGIIEVGLAAVHIDRTELIRVSSAAELVHFDWGLVAVTALGALVSINVLFPSERAYPLDVVDK